MLNKNPKYIYLFAFIFFVLASCKHTYTDTELADTFCNCAQPIIEWRKNLDYHYEKLGQGTEIKKQVNDCLANEKPHYADKKDDKEFQKSVVDKVNEKCPEANTAVQAMFVMLFKEEETE